MRVRELMTPEPEACLAADSCAAAGAIMAKARCGYVPVIDSPATRRIVGVLTDRDLALHLVKTDRPASTAAVSDCMTAAPAVIAADAELEEAATLMESLAVHRLPVTENGRLVGILSIKDIAREARKHWARPGPNVPERQMAEILEAIAAARTA
jgi:CBS domain-containing protein